MSSSMPRRPTWLLVAIALVIIGGSVWMLSPQSTTASNTLGSSYGGSHQQRPPTYLPDGEVADRDVLAELALPGSFEYRRHCIDVRPTKGVERSSLVERGESFFEAEASQGLTLDDTLPPCQGAISLDVPYFDPQQKVDTSELFLGMATLLSRIDASLPALARWLSYTGSPLLVLLVDQPDLVTKQDAIDTVRVKAADLGIEIVFEPYKGNADDTEGLKNFALAEAFWKNIRTGTKWFGTIDDDTFFVSLPRMTDALKPFDPAKPWYIGALTEGMIRIAHEGFKAWGGAGFFISPPLMQQLAANSKKCQVLDTGFGDILWRDCILEVTSPTVKLTQLEGLHQMDIWGDVSGWYESGWNPLLTIHHWKSWHYHNVPLAHTVTDVAGPETFIQRYLFADDIVMTNGYSVVLYPNGLPDLDLTELSFFEDVNVKVKPGRLMFHHSLGRTREQLEQGKDKISWIFQHAAPGSNGSVRQFYVNSAKDSVIEVEWRRT